MTTPDLEAIEARWPREDEWAPFVEKQAATDIAALIAWGKATEAALHAATQERDQQAARVGELEAVLESARAALFVSTNMLEEGHWRSETTLGFENRGVVRDAALKAQSALAAPRAEVE